MRVTDTMLFEAQRRRLGDARNTAAGAQERASTGMRVSRPSDDPLAASLARRETARIARAESSLRAADAGRILLDAADSALDQVGTLLARAREIAVQAANDTLGAEERRGAAREIEQIRETVIALGNTEASGSYVFGGYIDGSPPFDAAGNYLGDGQVRRLEVAPNVLLETGVSATTTFGVGVGTDVIATLETLRVALDANDAPTIVLQLDELSAANAQVQEARSSLGASMNAFDVARSAATLAKERATSDRKRLVEVEPLDAYSDLARAQQALEAAVQVATQLPLPGLVEQTRR
ncbi:MAG: flagellar hook-associated protein FlgL [Deltaproteobacteria bacterium]|nr:flagellar hook-associated protein FlgL [Deltaproteobacteria bacterium]